MSLNVSSYDQIEQLYTSRKHFKKGAVYPGKVEIRPDTAMGGKAYRLLRHGKPQYLVLPGNSILFDIKLDDVDRSFLRRSLDLSFSTNKKSQEVMVSSYRAVYLKWEKTRRPMEKPSKRPLHQRAPFKVGLIMSLTTGDFLNPTEPRVIVADADKSLAWKRLLRKARRQFGVRNKLGIPKNLADEMAARVTEINTGSKGITWQTENGKKALEHILFWELVSRSDINQWGSVSRDEKAEARRLLAVMQNEDYSALCKLVLDYIYLDSYYTRRVLTHYKDRMDYEFFLRNFNTLVNKYRDAIRIELGILRDQTPEEAEKQNAAETQKEAA